MGKVLIAEDDKSMANALKTKLTRAGYEVTLACDGNQALKSLGKDKFGLLLLDIMMPKCDGFEVLEHMKKAGDKTRVFILSNLSQPEDESRARSLGAKEYFVKSNISLAEVIARVRQAIG